MSWIDLANPSPQPYPRVYSPIAWPERSIRTFPSTPDFCTRSFAQIAHARRTRRSFGSLDDAQLSALLSLTCRAKSVISTKLGFPQSTRPSPSAGAVHPIHVVLNGIRDSGWYRYEPFNHHLVELKSRVEVSAVRSALDKVIPGERATLILFAAEPEMTFTKYRDGSSLVWRDAGVLQGYFAAAAEALGLGLCLIGVTGDPWVSRLVDNRGLIGVGAAWVGAVE
jgi:SagB-type dehydrogenase family enzyme